MGQQTGPDRDLIKHFEAAVMAAAEQVETTSGTAASTHVQLEHFFKSHGYGELYDDMGYDEALPHLGVRDGGLLVDFFVDQDVPAPTWGWFLRALRIEDRGYIFLWAEPDIEAGEPILGFWEPYDDQAAFEACFVAAYRRHADPIVVAPQLTLGERVSRELMVSALWEGLQGENGKTLLSFLDFDADFAELAPTDYELERVRQFVDRATANTSTP